MPHRAERNIVAENADFREVLADIAHMRGLSIEKAQEMVNRVLAKYRYDSQPNGKGKTLGYRMPKTDNMDMFDYTP